MTALPLPEPVAWCKEWDGDVSDLGNMMVEFNRDDIDNIAEWVGLVTIDQLHAYAAAKTAELQAELAAARAELATEMNDAELEADQYQKCIRVLEAECARLRAFVADLAENGTRFDLNPAVLHIGGNSAPSYLGYIRRIDDSMRERADAALRGKETP